ncbi:hypothetical protein CAOG_01034 [Capsaspora owczarzaki ATCC 30864]|uniref:Vacuolar ATPase assembly protein VMA22 n=1 Tax=Capsaspora owczarzaki (strain ATCC 30864) TaxID=595528 RepID=A0A0D2U348_CAPO3|nr:hypothetical protein CAOG_01034 [Capsaspora owczarzaki ATCC 30864]KJE89596.1 hypothetical protein CAOG_001034 [Capsaspora owczarzaki ATCC 30864]|eukprot:XP_004365905.1 hypothetical protein CAOG_01034 [Capsaspora owczarzaki ATCC 30864]
MSASTSPSSLFGEKVATNLTKRSTDDGQVPSSSSSSSSSSSLLVEALRSVPAATLEATRDAVIVAFMDTFDAYLSMHDSLLGSFKEGHFSITKARHAMGSNWIYPPQFPATIAPGLGVVMDEQSQQKEDTDATPTGTLELHPELRSQLPKEFIAALAAPLVSVQAISRQPPSSATTDAADQDKGQLRQRKDGGSSAAAASASESKPATKPPKVAPGFADPLRWFGVLTPSYLKDAQANFTQATQYAVQVAELRIRLISLLDVYESLQAILGQPEH